MDGFNISYTEKLKRRGTSTIYNEWINNKGEIIPKAVFAKVFFSKERTEESQKFVSKDIRIGSEIHTDAAITYDKGLRGSHGQIKSYVWKINSNATRYLLKDCLIFFQ